MHHPRVLGVGAGRRLTLASNVVLAARFATDIIITLDHRHFDVVRTMNGTKSTVLPAH